MKLMQLIYASRPFGYDDLVLAGILNSARRNNERDGITGSLICQEDLFLQIPVGGRDVVTAAHARILRDDRHTEAVSLWAGDAQTRLFPLWAMRHDPALAGITGNGQNVSPGLSLRVAEGWGSGH